MSYPKLPEVSCKYGAPMGRQNITPDADTPIKLHLHLMPMFDGGCYDSGGAYWGCGNRTIGWMYHAFGEGESGHNRIFVRATSRNHAKELVREVFEHAKFYR